MTPVLTPTGAGLYEDVPEGIRALDAENGYALAHFLGALATLVDLPALLALDQEDGTPGWAIIFDPDRCPAPLLPWVAMFRGRVIPTGTPEAEARAILKRSPAPSCSPRAIIEAAQAQLTGTKRVYLQERHGSAWRVTVTTLTSETPDAPAVLRAVLGEKAAGMKIAHEVISGGDFQTLRDTHASFGVVKATFADFAEVITNPAKQ